MKRMNQTVAFSSSSSSSHLHIKGLLFEISDAGYHITSNKLDIIKDEGRKWSRRHVNGKFAGPRAEHGPAIPRHNFIFKILLGPKPWWTSPPRLSFVQRHVHSSSKSEKEEG